MTEEKRIVTLDERRQTVEQQRGEDLRRAVDEGGTEFLASWFSQNTGTRQIVRALAACVVRIARIERELIRSIERLDMLDPPAQPEASADVPDVQRAVEE